MAKSRKTLPAGDGEQWWPMDDKTLGWVVMVGDDLRGEVFRPLARGNNKP
jgi:hypothetical protein